MFVVLGIQYAMYMLHIICGLPSSTIFVHISSWKVDFIKKCNWILNVYYDFIYKFSSEIYLIVAPCIFVESLQFINQRMHIQFHIKHFKTLRHISILSDHHQGALFLAKVILQYSQFNSYLQTRCCGSVSCCVGMCCGAVARCVSY